MTRSSTTVPVSPIAATLARMAAPLVILALAFFVIEMVTGNSYEGVTAQTPLAIGSSIATLLALLMVTIAAALLLHTQGGAAAGLAAMAGSVLVAGGAWASVFVLPGILRAAPEALETGIESVAIGYILSYIALAVGWTVAAVWMLRHHVVPVWLGILLIAGAVLTMVPTAEAIRLLVFSVAITLAAPRVAGRGVSTSSPAEPARV